MVRYIGDLNCAITELEETRESAHGRGLENKVSSLTSTADYQLARAHDDLDALADRSGDEGRAREVATFGNGNGYDFEDATPRGGFSVATGVCAPLPPAC